MSKRAAVALVATAMAVALSACGSGGGSNGAAGGSSGRLVVGFSQVVESGWDTLLKEAKDAKIPVVLTDRAVDSKDESLYATFLGSDFKKVKAGEQVPRRIKTDEGVFTQDQAAAALPGRQY